MIKDNLVFAFEKGALRVFIIGEINHHNVAQMRINTGPLAVIDWT